MQVAASEPAEGKRGPITAARLYAGHLSQLLLQCFSALSVGVRGAGPGIPRTKVYDFGPGVGPEDRSSRVLKTAEY